MASQNLKIGLLAALAAVAGWVGAVAWLGHPVEIGRISGIPEFVWGSLVTIGGVLLANWDNNRRMQRRLEHEARQGSIARKAAIRREIYLKLFDAAPPAIDLLGKLPDMNPAKSAITTDASPFIAAISQVQLVGSSDTAIKATELLTAFRAHFFTAVRRALPLQQISADIERLDRDVQKYTEEIDRLNREEKRLVQAGEAFGSEFQAITALKAVEYQLLARDRKVLVGLHSSRTELLSDYHRQGSELRMDLVNKATPVIIAMRQELEADGDIAALLVAIESSAIDAEGRLQRLVSEMEQLTRGSADGPNDD